MGLNVAISDDLAQFVEAKVESGEYASPRAVIEGALFLLQEASKTDEEKLAWLRAAVAEGDASGDAGPLDIEDVIREARKQHLAGE